MSKLLFSVHNREASFKDSLEECFDIIIIGGGITGAGIALDAVCNKMKVLLLEKDDYASGTSGKSTKLIHGGLRYLKQFEFKMIRDVGRERKILYENARHIVRPEKMLLPIYKHGSLGLFSSITALWVYDFLGGVNKEERKKILDKEQIKKTEPLLKNKDLQAGGIYYEYRTDDARLTIEVMKTAVNMGATCLNYTEVTEYIYNERGIIIGVNANDKIAQKEVVFKSKVVINAAGPWVDRVRVMDKSQEGKKLMLTKGVHLVFPHKKIPISQSIYFDTNDGRMMFAIPRQNITYIGTTDTIFFEEMDEPKVSKKDIDYLIENLCNTINVAVLPSDIVSSWAGLRPLVFEEGKSPSEVSRKDEIFVSKSGLISIAGGKLTGYRLMAEQVMKKVYHQLSITPQNSTKNKRLVGGEFKDEQSIEKYRNQIIEEGALISIDETQVLNWLYRYGTQTSKILDKIKDFDEIEKSDKDVGILAELHFAIENESVYTLSDFLIRRSGILYFESEKITNILCEKLNNKIGLMLKKSKKETENSLEDFKKRWKESCFFD